MSQLVQSLLLYCYLCTALGALSYIIISPVRIGILPRALVRINARVHWRCLLNTTVSNFHCLHAIDCLCQYARLLTSLHVRILSAHICPRCTHFLRRLALAPLVLINSLVASFFYNVGELLATRIIFIIVIVILLFYTRFVINSHVIFPLTIPALLGVCFLWRICFPELRFLN